MSTVTPVHGEPDRYYVKSFGSSHDSQDDYLVDLSLEYFGCSCGTFDYRIRPLWESMYKLGIKPNDSVACKHIKEVRKFLKSIDSTNL